MFEPITLCGNIFLLTLGGIMVICTAVSFSSNWWIIYFMDCVATDSQYFYLRLDDGVCHDTTKNENDDYGKK